MKLLMQVGFGVSLFVYMLIQFISVHPLYQKTVNIFALASYLLLTVTGLTLLYAQRKKNGRK